MNKVVLVGRVTREIELRKTQSGKSVINFSLAVDRMRKEDGTDFIPCVAWDKIAEIIERFVNKGQRVAISGRVQTRQFESNGRKVYATEIVTENIEFLDKPQEAKKSPNHDAPDSGGGYHISDDDLPF